MKDKFLGRMALSLGYGNWIIVLCIAGSINSNIPEFMDNAINQFLNASLLPSLASLMMIKYVDTRCRTLLTAVNLIYIMLYFAGRWFIYQVTMY